MHPAGSSSTTPLHFQPNSPCLILPPPSLPAGKISPISSTPQPSSQPGSFTTLCSTFSLSAARWPYAIIHLSSQDKPPTSALILVSTTSPLMLSNIPLQMLPVLSNIHPPFCRSPSANRHLAFTRHIPGAHQRQHPHLPLFRSSHHHPTLISPKKPTPFAWLHLTMQQGPTCHQPTKPSLCTPARSPSPPHQHKTQKPGHSHKPANEDEEPGSLATPPQLPVPFRLHYSSCCHLSESVTGSFPATSTRAAPLACSPYPG